MSLQKTVGLHVHTFYSLGDATSSPEENVLRAKNIGLDSLAITDHGTLAGWPAFKQACAKHGVKPIFGMEAYFVDDQGEIYKVNEKIDEIKEKLEAQEKIKKPDESQKRQLRRLKERHEELDEERKKLRKYNHLILLAKNWQGASNIIKLHNAAVVDGTYYKPRLDWNVLERFKGGIVATTACLGGRISKLIEAQDLQGAKDAIARFKQIFGEGNFFLELQLNEIDLQRDVNIGLIALAEATNTPLCVTTDSHFAEEGGHTTRALIRQLDKEGDVANNDNTLVDLYIKNDDMLLESWRKYMPEFDANILRTAIENTRKISDMVELFPFDSTLKFPVFETGDLTAEEYLQKQAIAGLIAKGLHKNEKYVQRLQKELRTIEKLGFAQYFNVVADFINHARKHQPVGIGRGSVGGSLLAYCLGITRVDPIRHELFFERFLDETKGVVPPTFGLNIAQINIDYDKITEVCDCHNK